MKASFYMNQKNIIVGADQHDAMIGEAKIQYKPLFTEADLRQAVASAMAKQREMMGKVVAGKFDIKAFPIADITMEEL